MAASIGILLSSGVGMVHSVLNVVWEENYTGQEKLWFIAHRAINTSQSFGVPFYQRQLMYRWFQCLFRMMAFSHYVFHVAWSFKLLSIMVGIQALCSVFNTMWKYSAAQICIIFMQIYSTPLAHGDLLKQNKTYCGIVYDVRSSGRMINQWDGFPSLALQTK